MDELNASGKGFKAVIECYEVPMSGHSVKSFLNVSSHSRKIGGFERGNFGRMCRADRKCIICVNRGHNRSWIIVKIGVQC
jgi:hypothetical protein